MLFPDPPDWDQLVRVPCSVCHRPPPLIETLSPPVWSWGHCFHGPRSVNSTALVGGPATDRDRWFDTSEYSSRESLSFERLCRAGGGEGGDPSPSSAPLRPPPKLNMLGNRSMIPSDGRAPRGSLNYTEHRPSTKRLRLIEVSFGRALRGSALSNLALAEHREALQLP